MTEYTAFISLDIITPIRNPINMSTTIPRTIIAAVCNMAIY